MRSRPLSIALFAAAPLLLTFAGRQASSQQVEMEPVPIASEAEPIAEAPKKLEAHPFGPLSYFNDKCARCHGENGAQYTEGGLEKLDDKGLKHWISAMAKGPGQSPLDEAQIEIEARWMRTLATGEAFAHLQSVEKGEKTVLAGEATPEAKVKLQIGEQVLEGTRDGVKWKIEAPKGTDIENARLWAEK